MMKQPAVLSSAAGYFTQPLQGTHPRTRAASVEM